MTYFEGDSKAGLEPDRAGLLVHQVVEREQRAPRRGARDGSDFISA